MAERVLVTGGLGYLGSVLCEHLLDAGCQVKVVDNLMYGTGQQGLFHLCARQAFDFVKGDVRDESLMKNALKDADVVIHLAAIVGASACDRDPSLATTVNLDAVRLLNRLRSPAQLVIYPNTNSGYGATTGADFCTEDSPLQPISLYGRTKVDAERHLLDSPNVVTLRLATVFGMSPRMRLDLLVNHFVYTAFTEGYIVIFEKDFKRNYVHVRDVADCMLYSIGNAPRMIGKPYNVGLDSANLSKEELAMKVKQYVPNFYVHFAAIGQDPDKRNYVVSSQRLREAGFEAKRSLDYGIQELLKGYRMMGRALFKNAAERSGALFMSGSLANVIGAVLAGGLGTRLRACVADRPKVLAPVRGRPYLTYLLDQLAGAGLHEVVLLTGYMGDLVQTTLGATYAGMRLAYSREPSPLGTGGALRLALPNIPSSSVLLLNGDSFCDVDLPKLWDFHCRQRAEVTMTLSSVADTARYGRVRITQDTVECFEEKQQAGGAGWINAGVYLINRDRIVEIPAGQPISLERDMLPAWAERDCVRGFRCTGRFLDIGTPESYTEAETFFRAA